MYLMLDVVINIAKKQTKKVEICIFIHVFFRNNDNTFKFRTPDEYQTQKKSTSVIIRIE